MKYNQLLIFLLILFPFIRNLNYEERIGLNELNNEWNFGWIDSPDCPDYISFISCSADDHVLKLNFRSAGITGTIPDTFGNLTYLHILDLSNNELYGKIPQSIFAIATSVSGFGDIYIDLSYNQLNGTIPYTISHIGSTKTDAKIIVDLSHNQFSGTIPDLIGEISPDLQYGMINLNFSNNNLTGSIPEAIYTIGSALSKGDIYLDFSGNGLHGNIPESFYQIGSGLSESSVIHLDLSNNQFQGTISSSITKIGSLLTSGSIYFSLKNNGLYGYVHQIGEFGTSLINGSIYVDLSHNSFDQDVPISIGYVGYSLINGSIHVDLSNNKLFGDIPSSLGSNEQYFIDGNFSIDLSYNKLNGTIPSSFGNIRSSLKSGRINIDLSNNELIGNIPSTIGNIGSMLESGIIKINLSNNQFTGSVPSSINNIGSSLTNGSIIIDIHSNGFNICPNPIRSDIQCNITDNPLPNDCYIGDDCKLFEVIYINESLIFDDSNNTLSNRSHFIISPVNNEPAIINIGNNPINIDGVKITLDFNDYDSLLELIRSNGSYEFTLIDGKFKGNFSSIEILKPSDSKSCEVIVPHEKTNSDKTLYSITFTIDKSNCSKLKWWMILLIAVGIVFVISIAVIITVVIMKSSKEKSFFNKINKQSKEVKVEEEISNKNKIYHSKSKTSPLYE